MMKLIATLLVFAMLLQFVEPITRGMSRRAPPMARRMPVTNDASANFTLQAKKNENGTVSLVINWESPNNHSITGYKIFFSKVPDSRNDDSAEWEAVEALTHKERYSYLLDPYGYPSIASFAVESFVLQFKATIYLNQAEGPTTPLVFLGARENPNERIISITGHTFLENGTVGLKYSTNSRLPEPLLLYYKPIINNKTAAEWRQTEQTVQEMDQIRVSLHSNATYALQLRNKYNHTSAQYTLRVPIPARIPSISIQEGDYLIFDPDPTLPISLSCTAHDPPPINITWLVNGVQLPVDHSFYTINTVLGDIEGTSTISAKARTRSDQVTCVATGAGGGIARASSHIDIRGPGSPPSMITLKSEKPGWFIIEWHPPNHPNGAILAYVLYYSTNRELPLSDWQKLELSAETTTAKVNAEGGEFFIRLQAVSSAGAGLISSPLAAQRDGSPLFVKLHWEGGNVVEPHTLYYAECRARGRPQPHLQYAITNAANSTDIAQDVWIPIKGKIDGDYLSAEIPFIIQSSKNLYCRANNPTGSNVSSLTFNVQKPGDAPRNFQIKKAGALDYRAYWDPPFFENLPLTKYEISICQDEATGDGSCKLFEKKADIKNTTFRIPIIDLEPSLKYLVRIRAVNAAGKGMASDPISFETPNGGPEKAPDRVAVSLNEANVAVLSWVQPNTTMPITGFQIFFTRDPTTVNAEFEDWQSIDVGPAVRKYQLDSHAGLKPKTVYRARVAAVNSIAVGPGSKVVEFETAHNELPIATDVSIELNARNDAIVTFTAVRDPQDHSKILENYHVELSKTEDILNAIWISAKKDRMKTTVDLVTGKILINIDGSTLEPNSKYWIRVRALIPRTSGQMRGTSKPLIFTTGPGQDDSTKETSE
ncbi:unnamed protein product, partial [Mesorhabditis spiculigera]